MAGGRDRFGEAYDLVVHEFKWAKGAAAIEPDDAKRRRMQDEAQAQARRSVKSLRDEERRRRGQH